MSRRIRNRCDPPVLGFVAIALIALAVSSAVNANAQIIGAEEKTDRAEAHQPDGTGCIIGVLPQVGSSLSTQHLSRYMVRRNGGQQILVPLADDLVQSPMATNTQMVSSFCHRNNVIGQIIISRLGVSDGSTSDLLWRLRELMANAARAPARLRPSIDLAVAKLAFGLGFTREAMGIVQSQTRHGLARSDNADWLLLSEASCSLSGQPNCASFFKNIDDQSDIESRFWRAVTNYQPFAESQAIDPLTASDLVQGLPLLSSYTEIVQRMLDPILIELFIGANDIAHAKALDLTLPAGSSINFARALLKEKEGDTKTALQEYDTVSHSNNLWDSVRATYRALKLRVSKGSITAEQAARAAETLQSQWHDSTFRGVVLLTMADWWDRANDPRREFQVLREGQSCCDKTGIDFATVLNDRLSAYIDHLIATALPKVDQIQAAITLEDNKIPIQRNKKYAKLLPILAKIYEDLDIPERISIWSARDTSEPPGGHPSDASNSLAPVPPATKPKFSIELDGAGTLEPGVQDNVAMTTKLSLAEEDELLRLANHYVVAKREDDIRHIRQTYLNRFADLNEKALFELITTPPVSDINAVPAAYQAIQKSMKNLSSNNSTSSK